MSYTVLARKWRPRSFAELVGQEHVARALSNGLEQQRLHHAFLFTGTRGVGKTTIARILAKCLNCEQGMTATPCGECAACQDVDAGRFIDLIEVDAASRTKVDDTRTLLDNVQYAPTRGRYKIYLIDEVHMLSTHSFNALLKTLEEPPEHVKFLLCTTDPRKLPITVLSRCLQFHLKRLPPDLIQTQLKKITDAENVSAEPQALALIAKSADGSMRDALSLLDQAIAFGAGRLVAEEVGSMLGAIDQTQVRGFLDALIRRDAKALRDLLTRLREQAVDYSGLLDEIASTLQQMAFIKTLGQGSDAVMESGLIDDLAAAISPEDIQVFYQLCLIGKRELPLAPDPAVGFEMTALRLFAFHPMKNTTQTHTASPSAPVAPKAPQPDPTSRRRIPGKGEQRQSAAERPDDLPQPMTKSPVGDAAGDDNWSSQLEKLRLGGMTQQLAMNSTLKSMQGDHIVLQLDQEFSQLQTPVAVERLQSALRTHFKRPNLALKIELATLESTPARVEAAARAQHELEAREAAEHDPNVQLLQEHMGAEVKRVKPID
ncbi:MAG: DNA polymerase III subunit gamma/tau [Pseudomonadota bacterium]|nr:DNA polymerase III subunit gamma/tau [Pseudomonadota bacterium]